MQSAPGSSTTEIPTVLRNALGPVMDELHTLRAELAELPALVITLQPSGFLPTSLPRVPSPRAQRPGPAQHRSRLGSADA